MSSVFILFSLFSIPMVLSIWPISYKIQRVEREYKLDFSLSEGDSELEMIPPSGHYNQIKSKMAFLRLKPKASRKRRVQKKKKYKIVEMFKRLWSHKTLAVSRNNKTNQVTHKSIQKVWTLRNNVKHSRDEDNVIKFDNAVRQFKQISKKRKEPFNVIQPGGDLSHNQMVLTTTELEESYDDLKREYLDQLNKEMQQKPLYNNTGNRNQTVKEKFASVKKNKNCTQDSWISLDTVECLMDELKRAKGLTDYNGIVRQYVRILSVWIGMVAITMSMLWCWRGWCCCCCVCIHWCYPDDVVYDVKRYLVLNPPGTLIQHDGSTLQYNPTETEYFAYQKLKYSVSQYS